MGCISVSVAKFSFLVCGTPPALTQTKSDHSKVTWNSIKNHMPDVLEGLSSMKFELPTDGESALNAKYDALNKRIRDAFQTLEE